MIFYLFTVRMRDIHSNQCWVFPNSQRFRGKVGWILKEVQLTSECNNIVHIDAKK